MSTPIRRRITLMAAAAAALLPLAAAAQLVVLHTNTTLQYGGAGSPQTVLSAPWIVSASVPPWEGLVDMSAGLMEVGVANTTLGAANTYASLSITIGNTSAATVPLGPLSLAFDGVFTRSEDGGDGSHASRLIAIATLALGGQAHTARLDHSHAAICVGNRQDCRSTLDTTPVLAGLGGVSINAATDSLIDAVLHLPAFTLAPGGTAQLLFSFQAVALADGGWAAAVDGTHSAHAALQLPAGVSITSAQPLLWATPVPEPAGTLLWALGAVPVWLAARRRPFRPA